MSSMMPESQASRALRNVNSKNYNKDLVDNVAHLNYATDYMASYMRGMQKGIDEANKDIVQKVQDLVENLIIIFTGGSLGDLGDDWANILGLAEAFIQNIPIIGDVYSLIKKVITGEGDFVLPNFLQGARDFIRVIDTMLNQIGDIFNNVIVTPINNAIQKVKDWFFGFLGFKKYTDDTFDDTGVEFINQGQIIRGIDYKKANIVEVPNDIPMWQTLNPTEDPSFPRINMASAVSGNDPFFSITAGKMEMAFIRAPRKRIYNTIGLMIDNTMGSSSPIYIAVYRMDLSGNLEIEYAENITGRITNQKNEIRIDLPSDLIADGGDYFAVGILQTGTTRKLCGVSMPDVAPVAGVFPLKMKATSLGGQTSPPGYIPRSEIDFSGTWIPWVCLGEKILAGPPEPLVWRDDFERANAPKLGASWAQRGDMGIKSGRATTYDQSDGVRTALHVYPLNYDDHSVEAKLGDKSSVVGGYTIILLRGNNQFTRGFGLAVNDDQMGFVRCTGVNTYATVGAPFSNGINTGDTIKIEVKGNVFSAYRNGVLQRSITDNGSPVGNGYRFFGTSMNRGFFHSTPELDWIEARDFPPPHPGGRLGAKIRRGTVLAQDQSGAPLYGVPGMQPSENLTTVLDATINVATPDGGNGYIASSVLVIPRNGVITAAKANFQMESSAYKWKIRLFSGNWNESTQTMIYTTILESPVGQIGILDASIDNVGIGVNEGQLIGIAFIWDGPGDFPGHEEIHDIDKTISGSSSPVGGFSINLNEI